MEVAVGVHQMNAHRREIRALTILFDGIVGGKKSSGDDDAVEQRKEDEPFREFVGLFHFALAAVRIRGSAQ
jgi:hypothetical protein